MIRIVRVLVLGVVWVALWGRVTPGNLVGGLVVIVAIEALFPAVPGSSEPITARSCGSSLRSGSS